MKQIITIITLMMVFATSAKAQIIGATSESQSPQQNTYSSTDLFQKGQRNIKTGNIIFLTGAGIGTTVGVVLFASYGHPEYLLMGAFYGTVMGGIVASPFWITGLVRKHNAKNMAYVPLLQQDIPINDNLTFTPSIGITNYHGLSPTTNSLQSNALSVGFSLNF